MTREEAVKKLVEDRDLTTTMLEPLGISFDSFLRFAQLKDSVQADIIEKLIYFFT